MPASNKFVKLGLSQFWNRKYQNQIKTVQELLHVLGSGTPWLAGYILRSMPMLQLCQELVPLHIGSGYIYIYIYIVYVGVFVGLCALFQKYSELDLAFVNHCAGLPMAAGLSNCTKHCHFCCFGERETPVGRASPQPAGWRLIRLTAVSPTNRQSRPAASHMLYRVPLVPGFGFGFGNTLTSMAQVSWNSLHLPHKAARQQLLMMMLLLVKLLLLLLMLTHAMGHVTEVDAAAAAC